MRFEKYVDVVFHSPPPPPPVPLIYNAGTNLIIEAINFEDIETVGKLVTLKNFNLRDEAEKYRETCRIHADSLNKVSGGSYVCTPNPNPKGFVDWLCANQICAHLKCEDLCIGNMDELSLPGED